MFSLYYIPWNIESSYLPTLQKSHKSQLAIKETEWELEIKLLDEFDIVRKRL